ncbi:hypothetical protein V6N13_090421 [Hibiscus sabdariffa]
MLIQDLENKVRFGQKAVERPGSGAGRTGSFPDRPPSQSGSIDGSRSMEFKDRPRFRGSADAWTRPGDERRGFQGGRDRGFQGNRDMERRAVSVLGFARQSSGEAPLNELFLVHLHPIYPLNLTLNTANGCFFTVLLTGIAEGSLNLKINRG